MAWILRHRRILGKKGIPKSPFRAQPLDLASDGDPSECSHRDVVVNFWSPSRSPVWKALHHGAR
eukprot:1485651-Alexandrium_andersonii.AAC.1